MIRVLVVDDSIFMRRVLTDAISKEPDMEVCGVAYSGEEVVEKAKKLGGTTIIPPQKLPDGDEMAVILDPIGVAVALCKPPIFSTE